MSKCTWCGGDGKEHCDNPDHAFNVAIGGETARLGCPLCKYPDSTLIVNGGDCENCNGTGMVTGLIPPDPDANTDVPRTAPGPPSNSSNLEDFLKTLKIHNKDLDACFNDAVAVGHLKCLLQSERQRWSSELVEKLPNRNPLKVTWKPHRDDVVMYGENLMLDQVLTIIKELDNPPRSPKNRRRIL